MVHPKCRSARVADSTNAAAKRSDFRNARWQLCDEATLLSQVRGRGPWQVLAEAIVEDLLQLLTAGPGPTATSRSDPFESAPER
jgi:hypothetical protein